MTTTRAARQTIAALSLSVLALTSPNLSQAAPAQPPVGVPAANPAVIDANRSGQLTIHKYQGPAFDQATQPADGTQITPPAGATPLAGITFTATRIDGVDLTTNAGWEKAAAYATNLAEARKHLGRQYTSAPTDAQGLAVIGDLPLGLYLVHEVSGDPAITPAGDFLVTLPLTDPAGGGWLYDVHVYPKNSRVAITKTVTDDQVSKAGEVLSYQLAADIPVDGLRAFGGSCTGADFDPHGNCPAGHAYDGTGAYLIRDTLDAQTKPYLEYLAADWAGKVAVGISETATTLKACSGTTTGCHYTLTQTADQVEVAFTGEGLVALRDARAANPDAKVTVTLEARVKPGVQDATTPDGCTTPVLRLPNQALLFPSKSTLDAGTGVASNKVVTKFAALRLHKIDFSNKSNLAGAVFTLYRTEADAKAGVNPLGVSLPTDAAGLAQLTGLHVTDFRNDKPADASYWLVETGVPNGYRSLPGPIEVKVLSDGTTPGADASCALPVPNDPIHTPPPATTPPQPTQPAEPDKPAEPGKPAPPTKPGPGQWIKDTLAKTGSDFGPLSVVIPLLLVGGGVAFVALGRRREEEDQD